MSVKSGVVPEFSGEYFLLSNFAEILFDWRGEVFPTAEHAFAYGKTFFARNEVQAAKYRIDIMKAAKPEEAKRLGSKAGGLIIDVDAWDKNKVQYMREIVHAKFLTGTGNPAGQLINTGAMMLVEGNDWGDSFWGRCKNAEGRWVGLNTLGVILMEERGWWSRGDEGKP